eukprot:NODE_672_length_2479_cov_39.882003_g577_i0.p1 GENE.NODE_672_length_2479_cov_39.882003_g577_i0~~NODE_672_length_2479_cov_39.882003_g577_i0.p1  ORF type:complete len:677 (+),score=100.64 NODE_672_length_2479_cov_39.882003_g577_i0:64-2031(+)
MERIADTALCILEVVYEVRKDPEWNILKSNNSEETLSIRGGMASGQLRVDILGFDKCVYDIFGEAVEVAKYMESTSLPMKLQITPKMSKVLNQKYIIDNHQGRYYLSAKRDLMNGGWAEDTRLPIEIDENLKYDIGNKLSPDPFTHIFSAAGKQPDITLPMPDINQLTLQFKSIDLENEAAHYLKGVAARRGKFQIILGSWVMLLLPLPAVIIFTNIAEIVLAIAYFPLVIVLILLAVAIVHDKKQNQDKETVESESSSIEENKNEIENPIADENTTEKDLLFIRMERELGMSSQPATIFSVPVDLIALIIVYCSCLGVVIVILLYAEGEHAGAAVAFPLASAMMHFTSNHRLRFVPKILFGGVFFIVLLSFYTSRKTMAYSPGGDVITFLSTFGLSLMATRFVEMAHRNFFLSCKSALTKAIEAQYTTSRADCLLQTMLPVSVLRRLRQDYERDIVDSISVASCMFVNLHVPDNLNININAILFRLDNIVTATPKIQKIKTTPYLVVVGCPEPCEDHAWRLVQTAFKLINSISEFGKYGIKISIGIHSGPVCAGLVGTLKWVYDIFGDTVNVASRLVHSCDVNHIQVSEKTMSYLPPDSIGFQERGSIAIKGKGTMKCFYIFPLNQTQPNANTLLKTESSHRLAWCNFSADDFV